MDLLKRHLFFILCGLGAAVGIALGVTGTRASPKVRAELEVAAQVYKALESVPTVNPKSLDAEKQRIDAVLSDRAKVLERAKQLYRCEPLVSGVFPDGPPEKRVKFRSKYNEAMHALLDALNWGSPPTAAEVDQMKEKIENERAAEKQFGVEASTAISGETHTRAEVLTQAGAKQDPQARASIAAAQRIYCYAVNFFEDKPPDRVASLQFVSSMKETGTLEAPELDSCWQAQLNYWIQKEVVDAVVALNNEAAEAARVAGKDRWIGIMPVKEVISVRVSDYVPPKGDLYSPAQPGGYNAATVAGTAESVFTGNASTTGFDVVQFTLKLIMDQRDVPLLVEKLCNNSFHTLVRASYKSVPPNKSMIGKVYGSEPTVNIVLDFETVLLGDVFRPLMPDAVCEKNDIQCPERKSADEEG